MVLAAFWSASWIWIAFQGAERRVREGLGLPQGIAGFVANTLAALFMPMWVGHLMHGLLFAWYAHTFTTVPVAEMRLLPPEAASGRVVLEIYGTLGMGSTRQLEASLAATPAIRAVQLDIRDGLAPEALGIADTIRSHGLDTIVVNRCEGVCLAAFAAGARRTASREALISCHKTHMPLVGGGATLTPTDERVMGLLQAQGIGSELALACHRQPFWSPWKPDPEMLASSWLVTGWHEVSE